MKITIEANIVASITDVWRAFNRPQDIVQWDASAEWHTTKASNDLKVGGKLSLRIEAKDGSTGFDFAATYVQIEPNRLIEFQMDAQRMVRVAFIETDAGVTVRQTFDAESTHSEDQERSEWQAVLDNFTRHVESLTIS